MVIKHGWLEIPELAMEVSVAGKINELRRRFSSKPCLSTGWYLMIYHCFSFKWPTGGGFFGTIFRQTKKVINWPNLFWPSWFENLCEKKLVVVKRFVKIPIPLLKWTWMVFPLANDGCFLVLTKVVWEKTSDAWRLPTSNILVTHSQYFTYSCIYGIIIYKKFDVWCVNIDR